MEIHDVRRSNLLLLIARFDTAAKLSRAADLNPKHVSHMKTGVREIGEQIARKIEKELRLNAGWMDSRRDSVTTVTAATEERHVEISTYGEDAPLTPATVPASFLEETGYAAEDLMEFVVPDNSQAGRVLRGDRVLVLTGRPTEFEEDVMYVLLIGGRVRFRRAHHLADESIAFRCASPEYPDDIVPRSALERLEVLGTALKFSAKF